MNLKNILLKDLSENEIEALTEYGINISDSLDNEGYKEILIEIAGGNKELKYECLATSTLGNAVNFEFTIDVDIDREEKFEIQFVELLEKDEDNISKIDEEEVKEMTLLLEGVEDIDV